MSPEQSAAVATAVPVAEPTGGTLQQAAATAPQCANCGAPVSGKYCSQCGQRLEHEIHSVLHFTREATEDLTHADSRLWSTIIALLFKPGFLTREFLDGRRVRYLPPLRLYLVLSVLFFLVIGSGQHDATVVRLKTGNGTPSIEVLPPGSVGGFAGKAGETAEQRQERLCNSEYHGPASAFILPMLQKACRKIVADRGRTVSEAFMHNLPRAMFIFLPALALMMKVMYRRPRHYYVEHLLFFVHNHAFVFLAFGLLTLVTRFAPATMENGLTSIVQLYVAYYLFVSMRRVYGQGRWLTFAKLVVLSLTYFILAAMTLALTAMYSVYSA
jgi:hypothetical protein